MKKLLLFIAACAAVQLTAQTTNFYGVTKAGGIYGGGTIVKVDGTGNNFQKEHDFDYVPGDWATAKLVEAPNGKLYGHGLYMLFEYDPSTGTMLNIHEFNGSYVYFNLYNAPGMVLAPNNKIYGIASEGGGPKFLFEFDYATNTVVKKQDFPVIDNAFSELILGSNNLIYFACTSGGGQNGQGCMYEYDFNTNVLELRRSFNSIADVGGTHVGIAEAPNGKIYGTYTYGSLTNYGGIYEYDMTTYTVASVAEFHMVSGELYQPNQGVRVDADGNIYTVSSYGGTFGYGGIGKYDYNTDGFSILLSFDNTSGAYHCLPYYYNNSLYLSGGYLGLNSEGTIIKVNPNTGAYNVLYNYIPADQNPGGYLTLVNDKFYTFSGNGIDSYLNRFDTLGNFSMVKKFGATENSYLTEGTTLLNNKLYGLSYRGGLYNKGTVYEFDPSTTTYTKLYDFDAFGNGNYPMGRFTVVNNKLIGATEGGGVEDVGQLFEFDPSGPTYTPLADLLETSVGAYPNGSLVTGTNNRIYGVSRYGGTADEGTLFEYDPVSTNLVKRYDFANPANGQRPEGIMRASNGKIYGLTNAGGANSVGVLFEFTPPSTFVKKINFDGAINTSYPGGTLLEGETGVLYGTSEGGGANNNGTIYKYVISSNTLTKVFDFDSASTGSMPYGTMTLGANNKMYGTTAEGGNFGKGVIFEYDYINNTLTVKHHFDGQDGNIPRALTLVCGQPAYDAGANITTCQNQQLILGTTAEPGYTYSWSPGTGLSAVNMPNPTLTVQGNTTTYHVTQTYLSCVFQDSLKVTPLIAPSVPICMTTVDSGVVVASNHNIIFWDKTGMDAVDSFYIYREITTGVYSKIAAVSSDSLSEYHDHAVNPNTTSYRYRISALDTCGNEGPMSDYHETIHLQYLGGGNLQWNLYDIENAGNPVSFYDILRDDNGTGNFVSIGQISGNSSTYTDIAFASFPNAQYRVKNVWSIVCTPTMRLANGNMNVMGAINTSRSNIRSPASVGIKESNAVGNFSLVPNPFNQSLNININHAATADVEIYNDLGQLLIKEKISGNAQVNTAMLNAGVYMVVIKTENSVYSRKLLKAEN